VTLPSDSSTPGTVMPPFPAQLDPKALGILTIPRLGIQVVVRDGVDDDTLRIAAGRIPGTSRIDGSGNLGIAAHRNTFFRPLEKVQKCDQIEIRTRRAVYVYEVDEVEIVPPERVDVLEPQGRPTLTLVTCFPFEYVGHAPNRFVVRAWRSQKLPKPSSFLNAHR